MAGRTGGRACILGVNNKVGKLENGVYGGIPDKNVWGIRTMTSGSVSGQPFEWATYVSFGSFQLAYNNNGKFAVRAITAGDTDFNSWKVLM